MAGDLNSRNASRQASIMLAAVISCPDVTFSPFYLLLTFFLQTLLRFRADLFTLSSYLKWV